MRRLVFTLALGLIVGTAVHAAAGPRGRRSGRPKRADPSPQVGAMAPDFELILLSAFETRSDASDAKKEEKRADDTATAEQTGKPRTVRLSSFRGNRPVVLVFTSYT